jgi:HSP20 family protein
MPIGRRWDSIAASVGLETAPAVLTIRAVRGRQPFGRQPPSLQKGGSTMIFRNFNSSSLFDEFDRLQRQLQQAFEGATPSIRGWAGGFPAINVGHTPASTEIYAFVPGIDPKQIDVSLDRGVLSISGERDGVAGTGADTLTLHGNERFAGRFRRVIGLPEDSDPAAVQAECRDGVLHISVKRRESALPRRIEVQ